MTETQHVSRGPVGPEKPAEYPTQAVIACVFAFAMALATPSAHASIEGSKHDFRSPDATPTSDTSKEICAFCHTPIGDASPEAPLWNPQTTEQEYERPASFGTSDLEDNSVGSLSVTCLSCHDGTQASDAAYVGPAAGDGVAVGEVSLSSAVTDFLTGHPVYVPYAGGACAGIETDCNPATMVGGRKFDFGIARFDVINSIKTWWVDSDEGAPGMRDKTDMILYPRDFDGTVGPAVECGSCHDPHDGRQRPVSFLRMPADDSTICLTCHIK